MSSGTLRTSISAIMTVRAITGATGGLGLRVAELSAKAGLQARLLVRGETSRAPTLEGMSPVTFNGYGDKVAAVHALQGVDVLFMVSAQENKEVCHHVRTPKLTDTASERTLHVRRRRRGGGSEAHHLHVVSQRLTPGHLPPRTGSLPHRTVHPR